MAVTAFYDSLASTLGLDRAEIGAVDTVVLMPVEMRIGAATPAESMPDYLRPTGSGLFWSLTLRLPNYGRDGTVLINRETGSVWVGLTHKPMQ
jgi:hypothetical protein